MNNTISRSVNNDFGTCKAGVPLTNYKRIGGSAVGGLIG